MEREADGWQRYLNECASRIGHALLRFALALPMPTNGAECPLNNRRFAQRRL
jgi:hypothetical protein